MKKLFITTIMTVFAVAGFAQVPTATSGNSQQYFRVTFTVPIVGSNTGSNTSVAATMKDYYTYCNPQHEYLDFQAASPMGFRTTTGSVTETSDFLIENGRTAQGGAKATYPYSTNKIKSITAYSIPVQTVNLIDSVPFKGYKFPGDGKLYNGTVFRFDRLPRNVAELKTLMEKNGQRVEATKNPLFIAAVMYLVWPRLLDCSQDCRDMVNYLFGTQYSQLNTYGISNQSFQNACTAQFASNGGKDAGGGWLHNNLFQHFGGATPGNQYKPNGKDYGTGPYKVRVVWDSLPLTYSNDKRCWIARILLMPNPDGVTKDQISFESPTAHIVQIRSTNNNGWFFLDGEKNYYSLGKSQYDDSF